MMKSFFKKLAFVMALAMVVSAAAPAAKSAAAATEFTYAYQNAGAVDTLYMKAGDEVDLCFKGVRDYKDYTLQWKSGNPLVATVDKNGVVKAVENGTTTIELVVGDGSVYTSTPVKVVVGEEIKVALGTSADDTFTAKTLEVGTSVDLGFYGVPNYSEKNYSYTWISNAPEVVKVDQKGVCVAVTSGSATVTVAIVNNVTGDTLDVTPVVFTVPTPVVELTYEVDQVSHIQAKLTFNDTVNFTKNDVTLERVYDGGFTSSWPIKDFECKDNEITFSPYVDFADGDNYIIKVGADDEGTPFTTSLGDVDEIRLTYKTEGVGSLGDGKAFTNGEEGDELTVKLSAELYSKGVKVTKAPGYSTGDIVYTLAQESEYAMIDEYAGTIVFSKAGVPVTVIANYVYFDENDEEQKVPAVVEMTSEAAPVYTVTGIEAWTIVNKNTTKIDWTKPVHSIAAYDNDMEYSIVALVKDNYGNITSTADYDNQNNNYKKYTGSALANAGYYLNYASANIEKLLVGPTGDLTTYTKTDTHVLFELHNSIKESDTGVSLVRTIFAAPVNVKAARYLDKVTVDVPSLTLVTDGGYTDEKFKVFVKDQYGNDWDETVELTVSYSVEGTSTNLQKTITADGDGAEYTLWGNNITCEKSSFTITFKHNDSGKTASLKVNLKDPKYVDAAKTEIKVTSYQLAAENKSQTVDKAANYHEQIVSNINYYTLSNGYKVGNVDSIEVTTGKDAAGKDIKTDIPVKLLTSAEQLTMTSSEVVKGQQFIVVFDPNNNVVGDTEDVTKAYVTGNNGKYQVVVADETEVGKMQYAPEGTYTVKVLYVSSINNTTGVVKLSPKYTTNFKVTRNNPKIAFDKQIDLDVTDNVDENGNLDVPTTLAEVITAAFTFTRDNAAWSDFKAGMVDVANTKYVENKESNHIVITDVVINVPLNGKDDAIYYTVTVPVNKAVKVSEDFWD